MGGELGNKVGTAWGQSGLAEAALGEGDYTRARTLLAESLALAQEIGDKHCQALCLELSGEVALREGDYARARTLLEESLVLSQAIGNKDQIAFCLEGLARVAATQEQLEWAARLFGVAEALREASAYLLVDAYRVDLGRQVANVRAHLDQAAFAAAWAEGRAMTL